MICNEFDRNLFRTILAKRSNSERERDVVDVPIILSDNFDVYPTACLTDIIRERFDDLMQQLSMLFFDSVRLNIQEIILLHDMFKRIVWNPSVTLPNDWHIKW